MFENQCLNPHHGDWIRLVINDQEIIGLDLKDDEIARLSKNKFKNIVKQNVLNFALCDLNILKRKHSKSDYLSANSLKIAPYLNGDQFSKKEAQILFSLRSKSINLKINFASPNYDNLCEICKLSLKHNHTWFNARK